MTLMMLALAFLIGLLARLRPLEGGTDRRRFRQSEQRKSPSRHVTESAALVAISVRELRRFHLATMCATLRHRPSWLPPEERR